MCFKIKETEDICLDIIKSNVEIVTQPIDIMGILNKESGPYLKVIMEDLEYKILHSELENDENVLIDYIIKNYK